MRLVGKRVKVREAHELDGAKFLKGQTGTITHFDKEHWGDGREFLIKWDHDHHDFHKGVAMGNDPDEDHRSWWHSPESVEKMQFLNNKSVSIPTIGTIR